ncbi:hypothetical protein RF11_10949 [Thelohanellus kitauei]|uniref:Uncharacterized protein n=1 Tax=Thelohanellus kitauei TaxID=669202 RepID=A0A0C2MGT9_THEKT|nr:hypothetical protein RF11_10949 [Thelohanellus kitauei]
MVLGFGAALKEQSKVVFCWWKCQIEQRNTPENNKNPRISSINEKLPIFIGHITISQGSVTVKRTNSIDENGNLVETLPGDSLGDFEWMRKHSGDLGRGFIKALQEVIHPQEFFLINSTYF